MRSVIFIALMIIAICGYIVLYIGYLIITKKISKERFYIAAYRFLSHFPFTRRSTERTTKRITQLSIYPRTQIPRVTVKYIGKGLIGAVLLVSAGLFLFSDIISKTMCFVFAVILYSNIIDKAIDKTYFAVLKEVRITIQSIEQEYMKSSSIPDALHNCKHNGLLMLPIEEIYSIISGADAEVKLQQFYAKMPFRTIQTLAGICYNLNIYGDSTDIHGESSFLQALGILKSDVNTNIEKLTLQKAKFSRLELLPILSVFFIYPLEAWLTSTIPGIVLIYNGFLGLMLRSTVILSSIIAYVTVSRFNRTVVIKENDKSGWAEKLVHSSKWRAFIKIFYPKKIKTSQVLKINLQKAMSKQKFEHLYTKKIMYAVGSFATALIIILLSLCIGKSFTRETTAQLSLVSSKARTAEQQLAMKIIDDVYFESEGNMSEAELGALISSHLTGLSDLEKADEIKRVQDKYSTWSGIYFRFWLIGIALIAALIGYFVPNILLFARAKLLRSDAEDDFMQLQTLVSILVFTGVDTLTVLREMSQHSTVHKDILHEAYHRFTSNPEQELDRLKSKTPIIEFQLFIEKLKLTVSELPMTGAFSSLINDRQSFQRLREIKLQKSLENKSAVGKLLSITPLVFYAAAELALPILILGLKEYYNTMAMM